MSVRCQFQFWSWLSQKFTLASVLLVIRIASAASALADERYSKTVHPDVDRHMRCTRDKLINCHVLSNELRCG